jgi:hypothetical protein
MAELKFNPTNQKRTTDERRATTLEWIGTRDNASKRVVENATKLTPLALHARFRGAEKRRKITPH